MMIEAALETDVNIDDYFNQLPSTTKDHCMRVSLATELLMKAAQKIGYESDHSYDIKTIRNAALYYDVGFLLIPGRLMNKESDLTAAEYRVIQRHCRYGAKLLEKHYVSKQYSEEEKDFWHLAIETALSHHERWDGKGYPFGLLTTATPLVSRAVALADTYNSIISGALFRMALPHEYAVLEISDNSGTQFDPQLVSLFLENRSAVHRIFSMELSSAIWKTYTV